MTKKFVTLCSIVIALSLCFSVFSVEFKVEKNDVTTANIKTFYAEKSETPESGAMNGRESYSTSSRPDKATSKIEAVSNKLDGAFDKLEDASNKVDGAFDKLEDASNKADGAVDKVEDASNKVDGVLGGLGDKLGSTSDVPSDFLDGMESGSSGGIGSGLSDALSGIGSGSSGEIGSGIGDALGSVDGSALGDIGSGVGDALGNMDGSALGGVGSGVGDALSGIGSGALSGLGGIFGGVFGGTESTTAVVVTTVPTTNSGFDAGLIIPVPAATQITTEETEAETQAAPTSDESTPVGETVDYAATSNPYTKPTATFVAGDEDESIKWLQWIFVYTGYGLSDNGITGVLDEDTVAAVKKLQKENKLDIDGNITEEVIKAAEELYYKVVLGGDVNAIEIPSQATTGANGADGEGVDSASDRTSVILLIVLLVIIWGLAIGGIVFVFVMKKKKIAAQKAEQAKPEEKNEASQAGAKETVSSISDLFEEAEKNSK